MLDKAAFLLAVWLLSFGLGACRRSVDRPHAAGPPPSTQGQPLPGQPLPGQPLPGQPMQGQPMQGQPMQGQPIAEGDPPPPPAPAATPAPTAVAPAPAPPSPKKPPAPKAPPKVEVGEPSFMGDGTVPKVEAFLDKMKKGAAQCIADHAPGWTGPMKIQFLVTLRGRAEGVGVLKAKGATDAAKDCVRDLLKNQRVGTPTADPTGVQFTYAFK